MKEGGQQQQQREVDLVGVPAEEEQTIEVHLAVERIDQAEAGLVLVDREE